VSRSPLSPTRRSSDLGPAWPRHAPWLFPIVGRLKDDQLRHRGRTYPMTQHGFARDLRFTWLERTAESCVLRLTDDETTRARYPRSEEHTSEPQSHLNL